MNHTAHQTKPRKNDHLRWCWLGFGLAAILWLGSDAYYQRIEQIDQIENFSSGISQDESSNQTQKNHQWYHYAAIGIALGSITYGGRIALRAVKRN